MHDSALYLENLSVQRHVGVIVLYYSTFIKNQIHVSLCCLCLCVPGLCLPGCQSAVPQDDLLLFRQSVAAHVAAESLPFALLVCLSRSLSLPFTHGFVLTQ